MIPTLGLVGTTRGGAMAGDERDDEFPSFLRTGVYRLREINAFFVDPVRLLNSSNYTRFRVSPSSYYARPPISVPSVGNVSSNQEEPKTRKRKRKVYELNERERAADGRHREVKSHLLNAHQKFLEAKELVCYLSNLKRDDDAVNGKYERAPIGKEEELSFLELGNLWQAPLYDISLHSTAEDVHVDEVSQGLADYSGEKIRIFNNLITNSTEEDMKAVFLDNWYILPKQSCFYMSDLKQIGNLIPDSPEQGFNLIVIDPPLENRSVHRNLVYPTLPNRYFLYVPIQQLVHTEGALVALWVTNREKLRQFVEEELFPKWGVVHVTSYYWLKVNESGHMVSDLDSFHHKPYECLLLGYCRGNNLRPEDVKEPSYPPNQVIISIPASHSRKPPIGKLLLDYAPGPRLARCLELFARELLDGWTSWGNEPLHFQDSRYFLQ